MPNSRRCSCAIGDSCIVSSVCSRSRLLSTAAALRAEGPFRTRRRALSKSARQSSSRLYRCAGHRFGRCSCISSAPCCVGQSCPQRHGNRCCDESWVAPASPLTRARRVRASVDVLGIGCEQLLIDTTSMLRYPRVHLCCSLRRGLAQRAAAASVIPGRGVDGADRTGSDWSASRRAVAPLWSSLEALAPLFRLAPQDSVADGRFLRRVGIAKRGNGKFILLMACVHAGVYSRKQNTSSCSMAVRR